LNPSPFDVPMVGEEVRSFGREGTSPRDSKGRGDSHPVLVVTSGASQTVSPLGQDFFSGSCTSFFEHLVRDSFFRNFVSSRSSGTFFSGRKLYAVLKALLFSKLSSFFVFSRSLVKEEEYPFFLP